MPRISFQGLTELFVGQLERSGATVMRQNPRATERPARMRVITATSTTECLLFPWTITGGGGPPGTRPAHERRIQVTNATKFPLEPGRRTLIGGWSPETGVWTFWDVNRHTRFSKKSPSFQVNVHTLETAHQLEIATQLRPSAQGDEVVVAITPDSLLWYVESGAPLHNADQDYSGVELLAESRPEIQNEERTFIDESQSSDQAERRFILVETMRAFRDAKFRPAVLRAYSYRCAVCDSALKLVDAAHIVPVAYPESSDEVTNGIALCRLHHGAYDNALLGIQSDYTVVTNHEAEARLAQLQLDSGLQEFKSRLPPRITLPASREVRPDPHKLILGMQFRRWPAMLVG